MEVPRHKNVRVAKFAYPCVFHDGKDKLARFSACSYVNIVVCLFHIVLGLGFSAGPLFSIVSDGAIVMADMARRWEDACVPRGVGRVRHDDAKKVMFLVISIVRDGVE